MGTKVTNGIRISVEVEYQDYFSNPQENHFIFAYYITIENQNDEPVQLISRFWEIFDSQADPRIVEGKGVIGQQPVIPAGGVYHYDSSCNLVSEIGKMEGCYLMKRVHTGTEFTVKVPEFQLVTPSRLN